MSRKVVVIGAGIGGLATAIYLARNKYEVTILEKNTHAGGKCGLIMKDGHSFDMGPTLLLFPEIYKQMFKVFGEKMEDHLQLVRVDPAQQVCFEDNTKILCTPNMNLMRSQFESITPGSYDLFNKFMSKAKLQYQLSLKMIIQKDFQHFFDYFNFSNLYYLLRTSAWKTHDKFMGQFFTDQRLRAAFTFQDSYIGLNPFTSPSIFSIIAYSEFAHGVWFPKGGMSQVAQALVKIVKKNKVKIKFNSAVVKIVTANRKVTNVITQNGKQYIADVVVANADLPHVYQNLLPESDYAEKLKRKKYSCSTITFFWG